MNSFVSRYLKNIGSVDGFILKYKSPSCGMKNVKVYHSKDPNSGSLKGSGFFGAAVLQKYGHLPLEDAGRLRNLTIRENFLNKIFTYARFRKVRTVKDLVEFHTRNKLLFMAYNQNQLKKMGQVIASSGIRNFNKTLNAYENHLNLALSGTLRISSIINVLQHAFGGFKKNLSKKEKAFFLNSIEEYRDERIPLASLTYMLKAWSVQFGNDYLQEQSFFNPFPPDLIKIEEQKFRKDY